MKYKIHASVGLVGCNVTDEYEIPDEDLAAMTQEEIDKELFDFVCTNLIDWNYKEVEE